MEKKILFPRVGGFLHGGDYNPEQWLDRPDILEEDVRLMKKAGMNSATLGVFSWSALEPAEGEFHFAWLETVIDRLYENGIYTVLSTPSGARPAWLDEAYPEAMRVDRTGMRARHGGRHNHCMSSPVYREKVAVIDRKLAERFGFHPGVIMYHISNEFSGECFCPHCIERFRAYLACRYDNDIEKLNAAWWTAFWSHRYNNFRQIEPPFSNGENSVMGLNMEWKRFTTWNTNDFMKAEIEVLRGVNPDIPVTANLMRLFEGLDYRKMAPDMDVVSWDNYPAFHNDRETLGETFGETAFQHAVMRSLKPGKPFMMMESAPGLVSWQAVNKMKRPGVHLLACLQAIACGSDSVQYFQWRKGRGSYEQFHGAVVDHLGTDDTRVFREVAEVGELLRKIAPAAGTIVKSKAALLFDWDNRWALDGSEGPRNKDLHYQECVEKSYRALRRQGLNVDVIDQKCSFAPYRFVAAPMQYLFHEGFAEKIREFVEKGGTFVLTYWSGVVDENDLCFLGGTPHGLMDVFGLRSEEIDSLYDEEENLLCRAEAAPKELGDGYVCKYLCQLVKPTTAKTLMVYGKDFYAGTPALLENDFGEGKAYYVCADAEQAFYDDLYEKLAKEAGVSPILPTEIPDGVEVTGRSGENVEYIFFQNFNRSDVKVNLPKGEVIFGDKEGNMKPLGNIVVKISR